MNIARRFWRMIELDAGWACHRGPERIDQHPTMRESFGHVSDIAGLHAPSQVFAHYLDGRVETVAVYDTPI